MGDLCANTPKSMLPVNRVPFLVYQVSYFVRLGCKEVIVVTGHLSEVIESFFTKPAWRARGVILVPDTRGTAQSAVSGILHASQKVVFLCNGDTIAAFDFRQIRHFGCRPCQL